jgi:hypothetical protein
MTATPNDPYGEPPTERIETPISYETIRKLLSDIEKALTLS